MKQSPLTQPMLTPSLLRLTLLALTCACATTALAGGVNEQIAISEGYVRAVPEGQAISAAFMQIDNQDFAVHQIVRASSSFANNVELHTHTHGNGMMKMRQIQQVEIPAGGSTLLKPGGLHIMLIGLTKPLSADASVDVTLSFEDGSQKALTLPVRALMQH